MTYMDDAMAAFRREETETVVQLSEAELARAKRAGDNSAEVEALCMLARVAIRRGDVDAARKLGTQALDLAKDSGDRRTERTPTHILAACARISGDAAAAREAYAASIALNEEYGDTLMVAMELHNLGFVELHAGAFERAAELFRLCRSLLLKDGRESFYVYATVALGAVMAAIGRSGQAARYLGAADAWLSAHRQVLDPDDAVEQVELRARLVAELGPVTFKAEYRAGAALNLRDLMVDSVASTAAQTS